MDIWFGDAPIHCPPSYTTPYVATFALALLLLALTQRLFVPGRCGG